MAQAKRGGRSKKVSLRFVIDCSAPVEDEVMYIRDLEKFLREHIKVEGKKGNLGEQVALTSDASKITLSSEIPFSKRYLKYLTKKYLKKVQIGDYLRVVAVDKATYQVRYLKLHNEEEEAED
jgi:large subunit ribosomal protein L22e